MLTASVAVANEKKDFEKWEKRRDEICKANMNTPAAEFYRARLAGGSHLTVEKLKDQRMLTPEEGNLLLQYRNEMQPCIQVASEGVNRWWPQQAPIDQAFRSQTQAVDLKLATGEIMVGEGVRLLVASLDQWRNEMAVLRANSAAEAEVARRAAAQARAARLAEYHRLVKQDEDARDARREEDAREDARIEKLADALRPQSRPQPQSRPRPGPSPKRRAATSSETNSSATPRRGSFLAWICSLR
jgi:hypothetical protein